MSSHNDDILGAVLVGKMLLASTIGQAVLIEDTHLQV